MAIERTNLVLSCAVVDGILDLGWDAPTKAAVDELSATYGPFPIRKLSARLLESFGGAEHLGADVGATAWRRLRAIVRNEIEEWVRYEVPLAIEWLSATPTNSSD